MELDVTAENYIKPKEILQGFTNDGNFYYGFTFPKSKTQIKEETDEYIKLLQTKQIKKLPHIKPFINAILLKRNKQYDILTESNAVFKLFNFRYLINPKDITISTFTIRKILNKDKIAVDGKQLYQDIKTELKKYVYLKQDTEYDVIALYIFLTYVYLALDFFPILHLNGEAGTGKSQIGKLISKMAFNSSATVSATKSSFFRRIDKKRGMYFMDEKEHLEEYEKELLNGCTYEGNIHTVTEKLNDEFVEAEFQIYAPVVLACINDIYGATSTRTIKIESTKAPKNKKKYKVIRLTEDNDTWRNIRDRLCLFWLNNQHRINDMMKLTEEIENTLSNRGVDAWKPIINLSEILDVKHNIMSYIKNYYLEQVEENHENDIDLMFFLYLNKLGDRGWLHAKDIFIEFCNTELSEKQREFFSTTRFGKCMRRIGYAQNNNTKKRTREGFEYNIQQKLVEEYIINTYDFGEKVINVKQEQEEKIEEIQV